MLDGRRLSAAESDAALPAGRACAFFPPHASQFKSCGSCRQVCYCCKAHQTADWPAHRKACKAARKAEQAGPSKNA